MLGARRFAPLGMSVVMFSRSRMWMPADGSIYRRELTPDLRQRKPLADPPPGSLSSVPKSQIAYCFSYTTVLLTAWPWAFVPVTVLVRVLPSLDTTVFVTLSNLPLSFAVVS